LITNRFEFLNLKSADCNPGKKTTSKFNIVQKTPGGQNKKFIISKISHHTFPLFNKLIFLPFSFVIFAKIILAQQSNQPLRRKELYGTQF
jgi:hypothetical protein